MSITVLWDDEAKTVLRLDFQLPVSWKDLEVAGDEIVVLAKASDYRIDMIINAGETPMPPGSPVPHLKRLFKVLPSNIGLVVNVVTNLFARAMVSAIGPLQFGNKFRAIQTLEEARQLIVVSRMKAASD